MGPAQHFAFIIGKYELHKHKLLLAVSGGLDSVVMAHLARSAGLNFAIGHCNFQLRGEESGRDEDFVTSLAEQLGCPLHVEKFGTAAVAAENKLGIQEAARMLRYDWFHRLADQFDYRFTMTAHHADDNIETVLMNFFRGTGLKGLTGMPEFNVSSVHIVRPLLELRRNDLLSYAKENALQWVEDSSNASSDYTRNFFRNDVLPLVRNVFPEAEENIIRNIERFRTTNETYQLYIEKMKLDLIQHAIAGEVNIPVKKLLQFRNTSLPFEIFREYGFSEKQTKEIMNLATAQSGKYVSNEHRQVIRHRNMLVIANTTKDFEMVAIEEKEEERLFAGGKLTIKVVPAKDHKLSMEPNIAQLDADLITWPLLLRKWKAGDYFYPLGLRKKKKISRFFIDQKCSKSQKENAWVMESDQRIVWVVGMRIDDRLKITPKTKNVLVIQHYTPR